MEEIWLLYVGREVCGEKNGPKLGVKLSIQPH